MDKRLKIRHTEILSQAPHLHSSDGFAGIPAKALFYRDLLEFLRSLSPFPLPTPFLSLSRYIYTQTRSASQRAPFRNLSKIFKQ